MKDTALDPEMETWLDREGSSGSWVELLDEVFGSVPSKGEVSRAVRGLETRLAEERGTIYYGVLSDTPVGEVYVAVNDSGLVGVEFGVDREEFLHRLGERFRSRVERSPERAAPAMAQVRDYLEGRRVAFDLPLDLTGLTDFQCRVLLAASRVPRGKTASYKDIARQIGRPKAARAVGQALARNPVPIVIPCHRVVAADGSLTGYSGGRGIATKASLLKLEGVLLD